MTPAPDDPLIEQAIAWHLRVSAEEFDDWEVFTAWLEADPRHNNAYEAVADGDAVLARMADLAPSRTGAAAANDDLGEALPRRWSGRWAAALATVALVGMGSLIGYGRMDQTYAVRTAPGEMRTLALADGTRVALNGSTEVILDKHDPRYAELTSGEAKFSVRHDAADPFKLIVGDQKIVDVGTVFNVQKNARSLRVEVAEGAVRYEDGDVHLRLEAGDTLQSSGESIVEGKRPAEAIGSWTSGRLVYDGRPLVEVAADLARARGIAVELGPNMSHETFTGVIQLDGDAETVRKRVAQLLGFKVLKTSDGWSISR